MLYATCAPGLEEVLERELRALGLTVTGKDRGGVDVSGGLPEALRINLGARLATRVLLRLGTIDAPGKRELLTRANRIDLTPFVPAGKPIQLHVTSAKSKLIHTGLVADVLHEAWKRPASKEGPVLHVRLVRDQCTVSIDTSGELLHKRGWRQELSRAPLRETLAAGLLQLAGFDGTQAFVDPMCGAGTLPIEAALLATGTAPGLDRTFPVETMLAAGVVERERTLAKSRRHDAIHPIHGSDLHGGALGAARRNLARTELGTAVTLERHDCATRPAPAATGLLIANAPYGRRVGHSNDVRDADEALAALGRAMNGNFKAWTCGVLLPVDAPAPIRTAPDATWSLDNGGIPVSFRLWKPRP